MNTAEYWIQMDCVERRHKQHELFDKASAIVQEIEQRAVGSSYEPAHRCLQMASHLHASESGLETVIPHIRHLVSVMNYALAETDQDHIAEAVETVVTAITLARLLDIVAGASSRYYRQVMQLIERHGMFLPPAQRFPALNRGDALAVKIMHEATNVVAAARLQLVKQSIPVTYRRIRTTFSSIGSQ